jgi:hypothetical protein
MEWMKMWMKKKLRKFHLNLDFLDLVAELVQTVFYTDED